MSLKNIKREHGLFIALIAVIILYILIQYTSLFNRTVSASEYSEYIIGEWVEKEQENSPEKTITKYIENGTFTTRHEINGNIEKSVSGKWKIENGILYLKGFDIHTSNHYDTTRAIDTLNKNSFKMISGYPDYSKNILLRYLKEKTNH